MEFKGNFTIQDKIEVLQRWILVSSVLYYDMDSPVVSDHMYDSNSRQLYEMKVNNPKEWQRARYTHAMNDFDGSTGFGFADKLNKRERELVMMDVFMVLDRHRRKLEANHV